MANATRFDMSQAITDFSITTTVDLRMLFLSMPMAAKGHKRRHPAKNPTHLCDRLQGVLTVEQKKNGYIVVETIGCFPAVCVFKYLMILSLINIVTVQTRSTMR